MARKTAKQIAAAQEFVAEAQRILDRVAGDASQVDVWTREVAIRERLIAKEGY